MRILTVILTTVLSVIGFAGIVYFMARWLQRTEEDRSWLVAKWIITAVIGVFLFGVAMPAIYGGSKLGSLVQWAIPSDPRGAAFVGALSIAICGLIIALLWTPSFVNLLSRPFTNLFTGGDTPPDPVPIYSKAVAQRNRGNYREALEEVRLELEKFPNDVVGQMMAAELLAANLNDVEAAQSTVLRLVRQPGHARETIAIALNQLADWHLKYRQDVDNAREALEEIVRLYPDSTEARLAAQRIAHLGTGERFVEAQSRPIIKVLAVAKDLGLAKSAPAPEEENEEAEAARLVEHLTEHPLDTEARERLAILYAEKFDRLDLAVDQLEQLVTADHQPARQVVRWLNLIADLQVRFGANLDAAKAALNRIIELYPNQAAAETAARRIAHLPLEMRKTARRADIPLGEYEDNIGLKRKQRPV